MTVINDIYNKLMSCTRQFQNQFTTVDVLKSLGEDIYQIGTLFSNGMEEEVEVVDDVLLLIIA